ncbi:MAG: hypothetical protein J7M29_09505, partial [Verrucomicrobia bacterium]|nr:hypothetical protein [Verrucomicrobiota bacterium]
GAVVGGDRERCGSAAAPTLRGGGAATLSVTADDRSNTLIVTGGREDFAAIERVIQQLDAEEAVAKVVFKVFPLQRATATKLQTTLQRLFANRRAGAGGTPPEPVTIIADSWANALIIGASEDDLTLAEKLIKQLDEEQPSVNVKVEVFPMAKADARRVAQTLQTLFRGSGGAGAGAVPSPVLINVDERLNAIIVSAGENDLKRIGELVRKLDTDQVARVAEIRVVPLQYARAAELATILNDVLNNNPKTLTEENPNRQSLLQFIAEMDGGKRFIATALKEGVLIVPDPRTNALVVSAPVEYMKLLELLVKHLDQTSPQVAQIRIFNLKNADARQMSIVLTSVFRLQAQGGAQGAQQRSIRYTLVTPEGMDQESSAIVGSAEEHALTVTVDLRTNSLIVGGTEHYVELASKIIETLDSAPAQERKTEVYRLRNSRAQDIEPALRTFLQQDIQQMLTVLGPQAVGTAQNILEREVSIVAEPISNSLLISASPRYFDEVKQLIEQLDQPQPQVLIQVLLAEVTLDSTTELGIEWSYLTKGDPSINVGSDYGLQGALQSFGGNYAAITGSNVGFLLRALQNEGKLEVLSRPQILAADNQEATINIGQRIPLITDSRVTERGDTINQFTYENVGVILNVTPRISPDGFVKMDIAPTISETSSSTVDISKGVSVPIINQRTATTTVTVRSGQTILIGGLISTTDDIRTKKIPLLGDLPGLGALFRSRVGRKDRKELLIVLTPQILVKGEGEGVMYKVEDVTRSQFNQSTIQQELGRDKLQKRLIEPLSQEHTQPHGQVQTNALNDIDLGGQVQTNAVRVIVP